VQIAADAEIGFSRAVRTGPFLFVAGTAPIAEGGRLAAPGDVYRQTKRCIEIAPNEITEAGFSLATVVRTCVMLVDISRWREAAQAHGETFSNVEPACQRVHRPRLASGNRTRLLGLAGDLVFDRFGSKLPSACAFY
jgi:enamine deaminase RidA (YjgF/YER057c/UK114 family)